MSMLGPDAVSHYRERGFYAPVPVLTPSEVEAIRGRLAQFEATFGPLSGSLRNKPHLLVTWLDDLIRHPRILDAVEQLIGPDILVWGSSFFIKEPGSADFVSWHQDSTYWGLEPADIVTAWVALSHSSHENGAMRVIPGSHKRDQVPHRDTFAAHNLLSRGQEIMVAVDETEAVELCLQPGEMSLHHVRLIHGSEPNPSATRRIGFAIRYLPTYVRQTVGASDSATLVRGADRHGNFRPEQRPESDMSAAALAHHAAIMAQVDQVLLRDTELVGKP